MKQHRESRRPDSGTITVLAVFMLTALMAMAGLSIDLGFLYTRSRMMYAVADSAVAIGMKDLMASASSSTISTDISNIAGQYGGAYSISSSSTANQVQVTVTHTYSLFFAKMLGFPSRTLTVVAIGKKGATAPALLALGNVCGSGVGLTINGEGNMTVNGDIDGNGRVNFQTGNGTGVCPGPVAVAVSGSVASDCPGGPQAGGSPGQNCWDTTTGSYGTGGPFADPFAPFTPPSCDFGSLSSSADPTTGHWTLIGILWTLDPGVYCTNGNLNITGFSGQGVNATGVSFMDNGGTIGFGLNAASTFSAAASSPNNVVAYTTNATACSAGQAIQFGGPAAGLVTMTGSLYAPNGCINVGANGPMTVTGSFIGNELQIGDFANWTIGTGAGGGGTSWQMLQ
jgi:Putative Tad-like Flp pilus-assembly